MAHSEVGRRCDTGCASWPDDVRYATCPICGDKTTRYSNVNPMTQQEARHAEFEVFYADWDSSHDPKRLLADAPDARGPYAPS